MKIAIKNYSFNKTTGEVTLSDYVTIRLDSVLAVINVTARVIIYKTGDPVLSGTVATNKLTVAYDTSAMADTDKLLILYDDANYDAAGSKADAANTATDTTPVSGISLLKQISKVFQDVWDSAGHALKVTMLPLSRNIDEITIAPKGFTPAVLTASGLILPGTGVLDGFFVNSTTGGTVRFSDALTATTPYLGGAITPAAGQYYKFPARLAAGCYVTIANTIDVTFFVLAD